MPSRSLCGNVFFLCLEVDKTPTQVQNIHNILAAAASRFTPKHLDRLFELIRMSWDSAPDSYREKLLHLIGRIGKDDRTGKTAIKVQDNKQSHSLHMWFAVNL